jgi:hypothetical protein
MNWCKKPDTFCKTCVPNPNPQSPCKEIRFAAEMKKSGMIKQWDTWGMQNSQAIPVQCGGFKVDWSWKESMGIVILEMDQFAHGNYAASCELARQIQVTLGYGSLPVHMIRYNPDQLPKSIKISIKDRDTLALERIQAALARASTTFHEQHLLTVEYLFYFDIPGSTRDNHVQTLHFKDQNDYITLVEEALPLIEDNEERRKYSTLAHGTITGAKERRAKAKEQEKRRQEVSELNERLAKEKQEKLEKEVIEVLDRIQAYAQLLCAARK